MSSTNVTQQPGIKITIALKFLHEARLNIPYQLVVIKTLEDFIKTVMSRDKSIRLKRIHCPCDVLKYLYSPQLTAASLGKFMISPVGFEHSSGCEKLQSQNFQKIKYLRSYFIVVTFLPREVNGKVISEIYILGKN